MSTRIDLDKLAGLLEKMAGDYDAMNATREAEAKQAREEQLASVEQKFAQETGEELTDELKAKIAADPDIMAMLQKMAAFEAPDDLGNASERKDPTTPKTASESLLAFCIN